MSSQLIPSMLSVLLKATSNFGLFFVIGYYLQTDTFSKYVVLISIATFLSFLSDLGLSIKIMTDFPKKGLDESILISFQIRLFAFFIILIILLFLTLFFNVRPLLMVIYASLSLGFLVEAWSSKLRYLNRYWHELLFVSATTVFPVIFSIFVFLRTFSVDYVYITLLGFKAVFLLLILTGLYIKTDRQKVCFISEVKSLRSFATDSVLLNFQPLLHVQLVAVYLSSGAIGFFGYAQKIIQGYGVLFTAINNIFFPKMVRGFHSGKSFKKAVINNLLLVNAIPLVSIICVFFFGSDGLRLIVNEDYSSYYTNFFLIIFIVLIRFNAGVIGTILTAKGRQPFRAKVNFSVISLELFLLVLVLNLTESLDSVFKVMLFSNTLVLFLYLASFSQKLKLV